LDSWGGVGGDRDLGAGWSGRNCLGGAWRARGAGAASFRAARGVPGAANAAHHGANAGRYALESIALESLQRECGAWASSRERQYEACQQRAENHEQHFTGCAGGCGGDGQIRQSAWRKRWGGLGPFYRGGGWPGLGRQCDGLVRAHVYLRFRVGGAQVPCVRIRFRLPQPLLWAAVWLRKIARCESRYRGEASIGSHATGAT
jgi:hypothetical protein